MSYQISFSVLQSYDSYNNSPVLVDAEVIEMQAFFLQ